MTSHSPRTEQDASMDGFTAATKTVRTLVCSSVRRNQAAELSTLRDRVG